MWTVCLHKFRCKYVGVPRPSFCKCNSSNFTLIFPWGSASGSPHPHPVFLALIVPNGRHSSAAVTIRRCERIRRGMLYCLPFWVVRSRLTAIESGKDTAIRMACSPGERAEDSREGGRLGCTGGRACRGSMAGQGENCWFRVSGEAASDE